jgi:DNA polymerase-4
MILHLDLDCFFVSAERINKSHLKKVPLAVGGRSNLSIFDRKNTKRALSNIGGAFTSSILSYNENKTFDEYFKDNDGRVRGIITTSSYEARAYGVKTAMSVSEALRYCPHLQVLPPNYPLYHKLSHKLRELLAKEIPTIEQFSIDEFFGDITGYIDDENEAEAFALYLKEKILNELDLPISIGIAKTKYISKLATNFAKPDGVRAILPYQLDDILKSLPISAFPGIGKGFQAKLSGYGIRNLIDVKDKKELFYSWGKNGTQLYDRICGIDKEKLNVDRSKKSIGLGRSFDPLYCREETKRRIAIMCRHLSFIALKDGHNPLNYHLKIKYQYGEKAKESANCHRLFNEKLLKEEMLKVFKKIDNHPSHAIIQIYITLSHFEEETRTTMNLLHYEEDIKLSKLTQSMQKLRNKYGVDIIKSGGEL